MPEAVPASGTGYEPWQSGVSLGKVVVTRCRDCRRWQWYPLAACPRCGGADWDWDDAGTTGTVWSWIRVIRPTVPRPGLETPYVIGIIELPEADGARVVALSLTPGNDPAIGSAVVLRPGQVGTDAVLFFEPASTGNQPPA